MIRIKSEVDDKLRPKIFEKLTKFLGTVDLKLGFGYLRPEFII